MIIPKSISKVVSTAVLGAFIATTGSILSPVTAMAAPHSNHRPPISSSHRHNPPRHTVHHPRPVQHHDYRHHRPHRVERHHHGHSKAGALIAGIVLGAIIANSGNSDC